MKSYKKRLCTVLLIGLLVVTSGFAMAADDDFPTPRTVPYNTY